MADHPPLHQTMQLRRLSTLLSLSVQALIGHHAVLQPQLVVPLGGVGVGGGDAVHAQPLLAVVVRLVGRFGGG